MTDWRTPYRDLWSIAEAPTVEDMLARWVNLNGPAKIHTLRRRSTVRDPELVDALRDLGLRVFWNPVFDDPRTAFIKNAIREVFQEITAYDLNSHLFEGHG